MQAWEIRIGNWVRCFDYKCQIKSIKQESGSYTITAIASNGYTEICNNIEAFQPIHLTFDMFKMFNPVDTGKYGGNASWKIYEFVCSAWVVKFHVSYQEINEECVYKIHESESGQYLRVIQSVHQLQNLIYELTGEEKKINIKQ